MPSNPQPTRARPSTGLVLLLSAALFAASSACGRDGLTASGSGDAGHDAGISDAGHDAGEGDAGSDGGTANPSDGGTANDGGALDDGGTPGDGGTADDGGTLDDGGYPGDGGTLDDGGAPGDGGACTAAADYGTVAPIAPGGSYDSNADVYDYQAQLNSDALPDYVDVQLWNGLGVFANGVVPGTYVLSGDELDYATCGLCVLIAADTDPGTGTPTDLYFATGGTVTITAVTPTLTGTLSNVTFTHVTIDSSTGESTPVGDGCDSLIEELDFSADVSGGTGGACTATADYGTVAPGDAQGAAFYPDPTYGFLYEYDASLNSDTDVVDVTLYNGLGVFAGGVQPGTYTLQGDELDYYNCGLCVAIYTDTDGNGNYTDLYFATGGTVTITAVTPTLTGTLTNVTFTHVTFDSNGNLIPVGDGCDALIDALDFSAVVSYPACTATDAYGTVAPLNPQGQYSAGSTSATDFYNYMGDLNTDAAPDQIDLELYGNQGIFAATGVQTGTFVLGGDDLQYSTCGLCLLIYTDVDPNNGPTDFYLATAGTVTLTSLQPTLSGTISGATFTHVSINSNDFTSTPLPDGCGSTLDSLDFTVDVGTGAKQGPGAKLHAHRGPQKTPGASLRSRHPARVHELANGRALRQRHAKKRPGPAFHRRAK